MYLSVTSPSGEAADLSPVDLIDPALRKSRSNPGHHGTRVADTLTHPLTTQEANPRPASSVTVHGHTPRRPALSWGRPPWQTQSILSSHHC